MSGEFYDRYVEDLERECAELKHTLKIAQESYTEIVAMLRLERDDLNVQAIFWRRAANAAVDGWNALEDKYDGAIEAIRQCLEWRDPESFRELNKLVTEHQAAPTDVAPAEPTPDPAPGLHIVDEEKPV